MFSPAAKVTSHLLKKCFYYQAGIEAGNTLVRVNDWKIEAIQKCEVSISIPPNNNQMIVVFLQTALSLLLAAGFSVKLAWLRSKENCTQEGLTGWIQLQII